MQVKECHDCVTVTAIAAIGKKSGRLADRREGFKQKEHNHHKRLTVQTVNVVLF